MAARRAGWIARGARVHLPDLDFFRVRHIRSHLPGGLPESGRQSTLHPNHHHSSQPAPSATHKEIRS